MWEGLEGERGRENVLTKAIISKIEFKKKHKMGNFKKETSHNFGGGTLLPETNMKLSGF